MTVLHSQEGQNLQVLSDRVCIKLPSTASPNKMAVMTVEVPPTGFVPPHTHAKEEECYLMLEGSMVMQLGNEELTIEPDDFVHVPVGTIHGYRNDGDRILVSEAYDSAKGITTVAPWVVESISLNIVGMQYCVKFERR